MTPSSHSPDLCSDQLCPDCYQISQGTDYSHLNTPIERPPPSKWDDKHNQLSYGFNKEWRDEVNTLKAANDPSTFDAPPDGGVKAWLVAAGAACIFFSALGFANSFGVFVEYYLSHQLQGQSADKVAWIGSVAVFMQFSAGAVGGPLFDRYGAWVCYN